MRTLEKGDTPILTGMEIFHNYVRPRMTLGGRTPAEAAGIKVEGSKEFKAVSERDTRNTRFVEIVMLSEYSL